ncbi:hypothetical protein MBANPS3_004269 [Mucor bainieri]
MPCLEELHVGHVWAPTKSLAWDTTTVGTKGQCADITPEKNKNRCIWNDAVRSTEIHCGLERAEKTVKEVFQNCVHDETPFQ